MFYICHSILILLFNISDVVFAMDIDEMLNPDRYCVYSELTTPESTSLDCPSNYRELMPPEFIQCARLASEENFDQAIRCLIAVYQNNEHFNAERIRSDLKEVYSSSDKNYSEHKDSLDPRFTIKDFIYEDLLRYFWWSHYYPVHEGLV